MPAGQRLLAASVAAVTPPRAGERVIFMAVDGSISRRFTGTAMTGAVNGIVVVATHDAYGLTQMADKNFLPVMAVRVGAIIAVDEANEPQGTSR